MTDKSLALVWITSLFFVARGCTTNNDILIDIMFVVDGSGSIGAKNFKLVKLWLANATKHMSEHFGDRAQLGVLQYSDKDPAYKRIPIEESKVFEIPFRLGQCRNANCMVESITHMRYLSSQTYTYYALRRVLEVEFAFSKFVDVSRKAIILMTDGAANDGSKLPEAYEESRRKNITNFVIGVANYRKDQLRVFANGGQSDDRVFVRPDFESLSTVLQTLEHGLEDEGFFCDECAEGTDNCHENAKCTNHVDGFYCTCNPGYEGDGVHCANINDCVPNPCVMNNTHCVDGINAFECVCDSGFQYNGVSCQNIDDCLPYPCNYENSQCIDKVDGYLCLCKEGYVQVGEVCAVPTENPSKLLMIISLTLVVVGILSLIATVAVITRRQHVYEPKEPAQSERLVYQTT